MTTTDRGYQNAAESASPRPSLDPEQYSELLAHMAEAYADQAHRKRRAEDAERPEALSNSKSATMPNTRSFWYNPRCGMSFTPKAPFGVMSRRTGKRSLNITLAPL